MREKTTETLRFRTIADELPEFCDGFLWSGLSENTMTTRIAYARDIKSFLEFAIVNYPYFCDKKLKKLELTDIEQITSDDINIYLSSLKDNDVKEKARARKKSAISGLYKYIVNTQHKLEFNPVAGANKVRLPEKDFVIYLKREEQEVLLNTVINGTGLTKHQQAFHERYKKRDLAIVFLFLDTGLRVSELNSINVQDIDFKDCSVVVRRKGRNRLQMIYFSDESCALLSDYLNERQCLRIATNPSDPLFVTLKGERLSVREIQEMVKKYVTAALPDKASQISPHKLRSSFAMEFYMNAPIEIGGKDILTLQKRMGHKSIVATNIYAKAADAEVKNSRNWR